MGGSVEIALATPFLTHGEWVMAILTAIYVGLTATYVIISLFTLKAIKRQAQITEKQGESSADQFQKQLSAMEDARKQTDRRIAQAEAQLTALQIAADAAAK